MSLPSTVPCPKCVKPVIFNGLDYHYEWSCNPGPPKIIVLGVSQKWIELDFAKDVLRSLANKYDDITIRVTTPLQKAAKELSYFYESLGWNVERFNTSSSGNLSREITMITGLPYKTKSADLLLTFWSGTSDWTAEMQRRFLRTADPVFIYREVWSRHKRKDDEYHGQIKRFQNHTRKPFTLGEGVVVFTSSEERKAA